MTRTHAAPPITGDADLLTYDDAARRLRASKRTVARLVASGRLRAVYLGRLPRIRRTDLDAFLAEL